MILKAYTGSYQTECFPNLPIYTQTFDIGSTSTYGKANNLNTTKRLLSTLSLAEVAF